jgi:glutaredoxin
MHKRFLILLILAAVAIVCVIALFIRSGGGTTLTLYYSESCPHCVNVESFLKENTLPIMIIKKEVQKNAANASELAKRVQSCGIPTDQGVGIPFLWDGKQCIQGDTDIIRFLQIVYLPLKQKAGTK